MDISVGFAGKRTTDAPYDQDYLAKQIIRIFGNQVFAPGQQLLMDDKSIPLRLHVKTVQTGDLMDMDKGSSAIPTSDPNARGILIENTSLNFFKDPKNGINVKASARRPAANAIIQPDFKFEDMGIGGLDKEFSKIFRKAFASRILSPALIEKTGMSHVKGMLLFGPPGTGKTLIARQIGKMLNAREPKVINGPEVLNKYVGQSEENVRKLFADAEKEYKEKGDESGLHIIIFDELDAVCKQRGSGSAGGTGVGDSVVNQLLSKLDGVDQLNNILLIGMTNRKDLIDDALMRPGRLEVHVEISLPDEAGRQQILGIHTAKARANQILAQDVQIDELAAMTKNFSGAEIAGLVRAATSFAINRHVKAGSMAALKDDVDQMQITRADFLLALEEVQPAFGVAEEALSQYLSGGILHYSATVDAILHEGRNAVESTRVSKSNNLWTMLLSGPAGSGKTTLAAKIALDSDFAFVRRISPIDMKGFNEPGKIQFINRIFDDAKKSTLSVVLIDNLERIFDWSPVGPRFSNNVVVALLTAIQEPPPQGKRMLVLATTSQRQVLSQLDVLSCFDIDQAVPAVQTLDELGRLLELEGSFDGQQRQRALGTIHQSIGGHGNIGVGVKRVLVKVEMAKREEDAPGRFAESIVEEMQKNVI